MPWPPWLAGCKPSPHTPSPSLSLLSSHSPLSLQFPCNTLQLSSTVSALYNVIPVTCDNRLQTWWLCSSRVCVARCPNSRGCVSLAEITLTDMFSQCEADCSLNSPEMGILRSNDCTLHEQPSPLTVTAECEPLLTQNVLNQQFGFHSN